MHGLKFKVETFCTLQMEQSMFNIDMGYAYIKEAWSLIREPVDKSNLLCKLEMMTGSEESCNLIRISAF